MIWCFSLGFFFTMSNKILCKGVLSSDAIHYSAIFAFVMVNWVYTIQNTQKLPKVVNMI